MENRRPEWTHKVKEDLARWVFGNKVTKITHHWRFTSEDTSEDWLELHADKDGKHDKRRVGTRDLQAGSHYHARDGIFFDPDHARLVHVADGIAETIRKIDKWEEANKRDRAKYERLKQKFT